MSVAQVNNSFKKLIFEIKKCFTLYFKKVIIINKNKVLTSISYLFSILDYLIFFL